MVHPQPRIEGQPSAKILPEVDVAGQFVFLLVYQIRGSAHLFSAHIFIPGTASVAEPVEAQRDTVSREELRTLIEGDSRHVIMRIETGILRTFPGRRRISVVYPMVSPVVKETQSSGSLFVMILQRKRSHAPRDSLVSVEQQCTNRPRIGSIEMCHVHVAPHVPMVGHLVSQLGIAAILFKPHVIPMPVGTVIGTGYHARKPSLADTVGQFRFQDIIRTVTRMQMGVYPVFLHLPRHDVDHAAHSVRAVQHRSGAPQHFHPFGQERLVGIGYRMTENAGILRMAVNQDH